ncbi:AzlD domain-containing protein [Variovorax paradoxus]|jgi:branched-subunit amino acid transport protein|uniref:AzlD domain-containing protein n=1 Tax=Variovorax paradoxus TaxID=34073 RepID=UPI0029C75863|nr:AzlD domain-containing protein [Variovorax paradoxus]WPH23073.1 AzlD domain-containing protein [Variovorax paradoxus]
MSDDGYNTIALSALLTILLRSLPIMLLSRLRMNSTAQEWLGFIPAAIMAAIITAELIHKPVLTPSGISVSVVAAGVAAVSGIVSRSLFVTVMAGVVAFLVLQRWLGMAG